MLAMLRMTPATHPSEARAVEAPAQATQRRLARTIAAVAALGLVLLALMGAAVFSSRPGAAAVFVAGAWLVWLFFAVVLWRRRALNLATDKNQFIRADALTAATWITVGRALLVSALGGFLLAPAGDGVTQWLPGGLYTAAALGDLLDGALARRLGQATKLGASLDVTVDAIGLLVAPLLAVLRGRLPPWYLLLAAAYPLFQAGLWLRARWRLPTFRERLRPYPRARLFAGVQMALVATALYPVLPRWVLWPAASLAMLPTLALFVREWHFATTESVATAAMVASASGKDV